MISLLKQDPFSKTLLLVGLSTDDAPTETFSYKGAALPVINGSILFTADDSKYYLFDEDNSEWLEQAGGGGYPEPEGSINITDDGTVNVKNYASAVVRNQILKSTIDDNDQITPTEFVIPIDTTVTRENSMRFFKVLRVSGNGITRVRSWTFQSNSIIQAISFPNCTTFNESCIRDMSALTSVSLPELTEMYNHNFRNISSMQEVTLPKLWYSGTYVFNTCANLSKIVVPKLTTVTDNSFVSLNSLVNISFPALETLRNGLKSCSSLTNLFLPGSTMAVKANSDALLSTPIHNGNGTIWVNDALVNNYKNATNWSIYSAYIRKISEYTGDFNYNEGVLAA